MTSASRDLPAARRWRGLSLSITLGVGITGLMVAAVMGVLGLGLWSGLQNTLSLLGDKAQLTIGSTVGQLRAHLNAAQLQARAVADLVAAAKVDPGDRTRFGDVLTGALAPVPQIRVLVYIDTNYQLFGANRTPEGIVLYTADYTDDPVVRDAVDGASRQDRAVWGAPAWRPALKTTILNLRQPVRRGDDFLGILVAAVSIEELSSYLGSLDIAATGTPFILYDGEQVLAHPRLVERFVGLSVDKPLPPLAEIADTVLKRIWDRSGRTTLDVVERAGLQGHALDLDGERYLFIYQDIHEFGDRPLQVGTSLPATSIGRELARLRWAAFAGVAVLALSLLAAIAIGRSIAQPISRLAAAARQVGRLELTNVGDLPQTWFRELNEQASAFNAMLRGLRWFEIYVPRRLVNRLVSQGTDATIASVERRVTVMFTDIAGFTTWSEGRPAGDVAALLNHHFELLARCIEEEGGTVDKFIGDSVMAFWGAPDEQDNQGQRACRAALAIARALAVDNDARAKQGEAPMRVRIGIHAGAVIVGNIGAPGRMNYTIIGDTVNIGQRLEQLAKTMATPDAPATIVVSAAVAAEIGGDFELAPADSHRLRGRDEKVEVFRLVWEA